MRVNISEEKLHSVLKKAITEVLNENKKLLLTEMAFQRTEYKERIDNLFPQILINWCMVRYSTLVGGLGAHFHWADELRGHILTVSRFILKGNDSAKSREKVLKEIWDSNDYDIPKILNMTIVNKMLEEESIDVSSRAYGQAIMDCIEAKKDIFNVILSRDIPTISEYSRSI
jgi:hypothetical protein